MHVVHDVQNFGGAEAFKQYPIDGAKVHLIPNENML
jgi:hypothetical protein